MTRTIKIANRSTLIKHDDFVAGVQAIAAKVVGELATIWPQAQGVTLIPTDGGYIGDEIIWLVDDEKGAQFLGEHMLTSLMVPVGLVLVKPSLNVPGGWVMTLDHEVNEQIIDPYINLGAWAPWKNQAAFVALEINDPVEDDSYDGLGGAKLSNYVYPHWFMAGSQGPYDRLGKLSAPLTLGAGGYVSYFSGGQWHQSYGRIYSGHSHAHSRRHRRVAKAVVQKNPLDVGFAISQDLAYIRSKVDSLSRVVGKLKAGEDLTMKTLDEVLAAVKEEGTQQGSLITLTSGIKAQLDAVLAGQLPPAAQAKVDAIFAQVDADKAKVVDAINANTPAATPAPVPDAPPPAQKN